MFSISLVALIMTTALALDVGRAYFDKTQVRSAADSGALAGAGRLGADAHTARATAAQFVYDNLQAGAVPTGAGCGNGTDTRCYNSGALRVTVTSPFTSATATQPAANLIRVKVCHEIDTLFAVVGGFKTMTVCAVSVAARSVGGVGGPCGLCLLSPTGTGLKSTGAGSVRVNGHSIGVNSTAAGAGSITGSGTILSTGTGAGISIRGTYSQPTTGQFSPTPVSGGPEIPDPLADLPVPVVAGPSFGNVSVSGSNSMTLSPGIYDKITSSSTGTITLAPGIYIIKTEIKLNKSPPSGGVSLYGRDVMIYLACSAYPAPCAPGEGGAELLSSGGAVIDIGPRLTDTTYQGMSIFADRNNTGTIGLTGSSGTMFNGTIYGKSATISMTGPSGVDSSWGSMVIAGFLDKTGDSVINLNIDPASNSPALTPSRGLAALVE